jgi:transcriptional regulator with XRE-family HTH domain
LLNKRLLKLRKENKLTQQELSSRLGIARTTYSGYELGTSEPDNETLENIADYYRVTTDNLLGREERKVEETEADLKRRKGLEYIAKITDEKTLDLAIELLEKLAKE